MQGSQRAQFNLFILVFINMTLSVASSDLPCDHAIVLAQMWSCVGTKTGGMETDEMLQVLQTRTSLCTWLMPELRVLSVGSTEGTVPHCESGFTAGFSADFM